MTDLEAWERESLRYKFDNRDPQEVASKWFARGYRAAAERAERDIHRREAEADNAVERARKERDALRAEKVALTARCAVLERTVEAAKLAVERRPAVDFWHRMDDLAEALRALAAADDKMCTASSSAESPAPAVSPEEYAESPAPAAPCWVCPTCRHESHTWQEHEAHRAACDAAQSVVTVFSEIDKMHAEHDCAPGPCKCPCGCSKPVGCTAVYGAICLDCHMNVLRERNDICDRRNA